MYDKFIDLLSYVDGYKGNDRAIRALEWIKSNQDFEGGLTLEEIGKVIGVTRERVRQIESSAIKKLKHPRIGKVLKDYYRS